jgi:hypothetical protein
MKRGREKKENVKENGGKTEDEKEIEVKRGK